MIHLYYQHSGWHSSFWVDTDQKPQWCIVKYCSSFTNCSRLDVPHKNYYFLSYIIFLSAHRNASYSLCLSLYFLSSLLSIHRMRELFLKMGEREDSEIMVSMAASDLSCKSKFQ